MFHLSLQPVLRTPGELYEMVSSGCGCEMIVGCGLVYNTPAPNHRSRSVMPASPSHVLPSFCLILFIDNAL